MAAPVRSAEYLVRRHHTARHVAHQGGARGRRDIESFKKRFQRIQGRLHQGAVERLARMDRPHPDFFGLETLRDRLDRAHGPAQHLVRPVPRRNPQPLAPGRLVVLAHRLLNHREGSEHRRHRPGFRDRREYLAPPQDGPHPVFESEHARRLRRPELPDAVPHHHVRANPHARPERRDRALERVDGRLRPDRVVEVASAAPEHHVQKRGAPCCANDFFAAIENRPRHRLALIQVPPHADPLAPLTGEEERHLSRRPRLRRFAAFGQGAQSLAQPCSVVEGETRAVREMAPPHGGRPRHVREQRLRGGALGCKLFAALIEPGEIPPR